MFKFIQTNEIKVPITCICFSRSTSWILEQQSIFFKETKFGCKYLKTFHLEVKNRQSKMFIYFCLD